LQILDTGDDDAFERITKMASKLFNVPICLVSLVDADRQYFKSKRGLVARETSRDMAFCAYAVLPDAPDVFVVPDATTDRRFMFNALVTGPPDLRFYAGAPLILDGGLKIGTLCFLDTVPHDSNSFSAADMMNLVDLAQMVVVELKLRKRLKQSQLGYITATAHNLQTPLACFELSLQLLKETSLSIEHADVVTEAVTSLDAMRWTTTKALDSARKQLLLRAHDTASAAINVTPVNLKQLVERVQRMIEIVPRSVPIHIDIANDVSDSVWTDSVAIWHCLIDLFTNACRFTTEGSITVSIKRKLIEHKAECVVLSVIDTGTGIDAATAKKIFRVPFISNSSKKDGTGLGLYCVSTTMDEIGGRCGHCNLNTTATTADSSSSASTSASNGSDSSTASAVAVTGSMFWLEVFNEVPGMCAIVPWHTYHIMLNMYHVLFTITHCTYYWTC
jgi:two-component system, sensor histidine kinase